MRILGLNENDFVKRGTGCLDVPTVLASSCPRHLFRLSPVSRSHCPIPAKRDTPTRLTTGSACVRKGVASKTSFRAGPGQTPPHFKTCVYVAPKVTNTPCGRRSCTVLCAYGVWEVKAEAPCGKALRRAAAPVWPRQQPRPAWNGPRALRNSGSVPPANTTSRDRAATTRF